VKLAGIEAELLKFRDRKAAKMMRELNQVAGQTNYKRLNSYNVTDHV
jgi:hypothetical protein